MTDTSQRLDELRQGIDALDSQLVEMLAERAALTTEVGKINCCVAEAEEAEQWHPEEVQHQQAEDHIEC